MPEHIPFNVHQARTADGVLIRGGLRVYDNDLSIGTVVIEDEQRTACCGDSAHTGQKRVSGAWFTDHERSECSHDGGYCRHDHWFKVVLDYIPDSENSGNRHGGYRHMNGERLSTTFNGKPVPPFDYGPSIQKAVEQSGYSNVPMDPDEWARVAAQEEAEERTLIDPSNYRVTRVTHEAKGETLHEEADCPQDETCPVWADLNRHPVLRALVGQGPELQPLPEPCSHCGTQSYDSDVLVEIALGQCKYDDTPTHLCQPENREANLIRAEARARRALRIVTRGE